MLRQTDPIPWTGVELETIAKALGAPATRVYLGELATESAVKQDEDLKRARIVSFATHGVLPGQIGEIGEPGLIFTPPERASFEDDGLLSASEVMQLSLNADFVVLSACNTASSNGSAQPDNLSALAGAFLYAGARGLLASHWSVPDKATTSLMVELFRYRAEHFEASRAEALQYAMRAVRTGVRDDGSVLKEYDPAWAHPASWAPFSVITADD